MRVGRGERKLIAEPKGNFDGDESGYRKIFLRRHWPIVALFAVAGILTAAGGVYVIWWFTGYAQIIGLVPSILMLWSMNSLLMFTLHLIFWELILIGIPAGVGAALGWLWYRRLPAEEKRELSFGKSSRSRDAGGAFSTLLSIAFGIKVYIDGNWYSAISTWSLDYVVGSCITILVWFAAIFAIPAILGVVWWIRHKAGLK
ncbi:MAG: hypothetical protein LUP94_02355 [Candidatus Methanomethylicus sp.]|nr:hypothetical protein [Candidatus Methanomethylicus sp.]